MSDAKPNYWLLIGGAAAAAAVGAYLVFGSASSQPAARTERSGSEPCPSGKDKAEKKGEPVMLHEYQWSWLAKKASEFKLKGGAGKALRCCINFARSAEADANAIFVKKHCLRCGKSNPRGRKADPLKPREIKLYAVQSTFLATKVGEKVKNLSKAARCCVDWAIKEEEAGRGHDKALFETTRCVHCG
jgi:hypothetical protein